MLKQTFFSNLIAFLLLLVHVNCSLNLYYANYLAHMSSITYQQAQSINNWNCTICSQYPVSNAKTFLVNDVQGFTGFSQNTGAIVVAFRGSVNIENWIKDIFFLQGDYQGCQGCEVHDGFSDDYQEINTVMLDQIQQLRRIYRGRRIQVTGHSMGGAIALLAALDIIKIYGKESVSDLYTFGQPRVGNHQFSLYFDQITKQNRLERIIHYADLVPHLPPSALDYQHSGQEVWFDYQMQNYKTCFEEENKCSNSLQLLSFSLSDHSIDYYLMIKYDWKDRISSQFYEFVDWLKNALSNLGIDQ